MSTLASSLEGSPSGWVSPWVSWRCSMSSTNPAKLPESDLMHVSVIIPTCNRPDLVGSSVAHVLANDYPRFDVTVVDQSEDDQTGQIIRGLMTDDGRLRYVHTDVDGLSRAYNIGAQ